MFDRCPVSLHCKQFLRVQHTWNHREPGDSGELQELPEKKWEFLASPASVSAQGTRGNPSPGRAGCSSHPKPKRGGGDALSSFTIKNWQQKHRQQY